MLSGAYGHWSVAVLTVAVHSSFFPTFDFFKQYVAFCTGFNLLTPIFLLPYIIMDLPIFQQRSGAEQYCSGAENASKAAFLV